MHAYLAKLRPERLTASAETNKARLAEAIAEARAAGVAQTVDQAADGVTGTAALIHDAGGHGSGPLVIAAPGVRSPDRLAELRRLVREEALLISRSLGWLENAADQA